MVLFLGLILILWGIFILFSSLFRMKEGDYKDKSLLGVSGLIEFELLLRLLTRYSSSVIKVFVILFGISCIVLGIFLTVNN
jgi:uncharacterized membrane protein